MTTHEDNNSEHTSTMINDLIKNYRSQNNRCRVKLNELQSKKKNDDSINESMRSTSSTKSIMIVRTLNESLNETKITSLKRRRRNAKIQINNIKKHGSFESERRDDMDTSTSSLSTTLGSSVEFDKISIREYEVVCGDNPSVLNGPPLSIGWEHALCYDGLLEDFEKERNQNRRHPFAMKLPPHERRKLLTRHGHTEKQIDSCARKAAADRKKRIQTIDQYEMNPKLYENLERISRALTSPFRRRQKKAEKKLWQDVTQSS